MIFFYIYICPFWPPNISETVRGIKNLIWLNTTDRNCSEDFKTEKMHTNHT